MSVGFAGSSDGQEAVVVLGVARSGTSALSGALDILGVPFAGRLKPLDDWNAKGNYEHAELSDANKRILRALDSDWSDESPLPGDWNERREVRAIGVDISKIIQRDFSALPVFGIKDPRLTLLLPVYLRVFDELGIRPWLVAMRRARAEVIASVHETPYLRGAFSVGRVARLYDKYEMHIVRDTGGRQLLRIDYGSLLEDPEATVRRLRTFFGFPIRDGAATLMEIGRFLVPALRHHAPE